MQRILLVLFIAVLVVGCGRTKKTDESAAAGEPFDVNAADEAALQAGEGSPLDIPLGVSNARFGEPGSGMLPADIDAEAKMILRDVHFAYDSSTILPEEAAIIGQVSTFLKKYPQVVIQVEGHCDERGTEEYNMALGSRRANAVRQSVTENGVEPNRVNVISYGEMRPLSPGHDESSWAQNRRGHFLVGLAK